MPSRPPSTRPARSGLRSRPATTPAGTHYRGGPPMTSREPETRIPVTSQGELLAVVPRMLGFEPSRSLVVVGLMQPRGRVGVMFRYDLPPMDLMPTAADHAAPILTGHAIRDAGAIGYCTGQEITPPIDLLRHQMIPQEGDGRGR